MNITTARTIAEKHGLQVIPANGLPGYCLTDGNTVKGYCPMAMTAAEFEAKCQRAVNPQRATAEETAAYRTAENEQRKPRRSIVTGRYKPQQER